MRNFIKPINTGILIAAIMSSSCVTTRSTSGELNRCLMFAGQQNYENAIRECRTAIASGGLTTEEQVTAYSNLGAAYVQMGKNNLALEALQNARTLNPNDPFTLYNIAAVHCLRDQSDLGLASLDKALGNGFHEIDSLRFDNDLDNCRAEPEYRAVLEKHNIFIQ